MTRLNRLYKSKLAHVDIDQDGFNKYIKDDEDLDVESTVNVVDEDAADLSNAKQLSRENEYPAGEEPQSHSLTTEPSFGVTRRIEGKEGGGLSAILALVPTPEACDDIVEAMSDDLHEAPEDLHITLLYLGKDLSSEDISKIGACLDAICPDYEPLHCKMQGLGVFDHEDEGGRPFYSSIDAIGMAKLRTDLVSTLEDAGLEIEHKYDFTPHMTLGYIQPDDMEFSAGSPGVEWVSDKIVLMNGDKHTEFKLGKIGSPNKDIYTLSDETVDPGVDDKEAIGLPDNGMDENSYGSDYGRLDKAIPRDPKKNGPLYGR